MRKQEVLTSTGRKRGWLIILSFIILIITSSIFFTTGKNESVIGLIIIIYLLYKAYSIPFSELYEKTE